MVLLEPALSETVAATCLTVVREALDETIRRGVPEAAARDFLMGHINIDLAVLFNELDWQFSAGCQKAIADAKKAIFQPDWKKVFQPGGGPRKRGADHRRKAGLRRRCVWESDLTRWHGRSACRDTRRRVR